MNKFNMTGIKLIVSILLVFISFVFFIDYGYSQNVAINKKYTLSVSPNYKLTKSNFDNIELTDGKFTDGFFWTQKSTVGWNYISRLSIKIDLEEIVNIGQIKFSTSRGSGSQVAYPANILAYGSNDDLNFFYLGDVASDPENKQGGYKKTKLTLNNINTNVRYVYLAIVPSGKFLFCDEIEVYKSNGKARKIGSNNLVKFSNIENNINSILLQKSRQIRSYDYLKDRNVTLNKNSNINATKLEDDSKRVTELREKLGSDFVITEFNAWKTISPEFNPNTNHKTLNFQLQVQQNKSQYAAFVLTNLRNEQQEYTFSIGNGKGDKVELFKSEFVPTINNGIVSDALLTVSNNEVIKVDAATSCLFLFRIKGKSIGVSNSIITINDSKQIRKIIIKGKTLNLSKQRSYKLNANVWAYLYYPILKNNRTQVIDDLKSHYINTLVLPQAKLPLINKLDFSVTLKYLSGIRSIDNLLLFHNFKNSNNKTPDKHKPFMSKEWQQDYLNWYKAFKLNLDKSNFKYKNILLYPYDEIKEADLSDFIRFARWIKNAFPDIKLFATLDEVRVAEKVLPYLDIVQVAISKERQLQTLLRKHPNVWIYDTKGQARSLNPYKYYRLQAWNAFLNGYKGVGFWNYADIAKNQKINYYTDSYVNGILDYSVVYNKPDGSLVSSRRWEAFSQGIEDFELLKIYSEKFGDTKAKELARKIILNPDDESLADSVREQIINALQY